ncbi:MAG: FAD-dependent oxidoreductase, partial [Actinoallomurus sp.]
DTPRTLYRALRAGRFLLVLPPGVDVDVWRATGWADRVDVATAGGLTRTVVLVRPDGYVAWADGDAGPAGRAAAIRTALARWCGPSADRVAH